MPNEESDPHPRKMKDTGGRQAKGCCLLFVSIFIACVILVVAGIAGIIIVDTVNIRGEGYTFPQRVQRYKVAGQFLWVDFKTWVSKRFSDAPPTESGPPTENEPPSGDAPSL